MTQRMRTVLGQVAGRAVLLGAIALVAVGISGGVAAAMGALFGHSFVAGDEPGVRYSAARCADFFEYEPHAHTCEQAATEHHYGEVVSYRVAAGLFGALVLGACAFLRRRPELFRTDRLPVAFDETVAALCFGGAAAFLLGNGLDRAIVGHDGAGMFLSGGVVAAIAAALAGMRFLQRVNEGLSL